MSNQATTKLYKITQCPTITLHNGKTAPLPDGVVAAPDTGVFAYMPIVYVDAGNSEREFNLDNAVWVDLMKAKIAVLLPNQ